MGRKFARNYNIILSLILILLCSCVSTTKIVSVSAEELLWQHSHLDTVKLHICDKYKQAYTYIIKKADKICTQPIVVVTDKEFAPDGGTFNDYYSLARYYWPDTTSINGLPYIARDGFSNPEVEKYDRRRLSKLAKNLRILSLAWYLSNENKYANMAVTQVKAFFIDENTRMNPNLKFAQVKKGISNWGSAAGLIDGHSFIDLLDALIIIEKYEGFSTKDKVALKNWFENYYYWLTHSVSGYKASMMNNNHSIVYDTQLLAISSYLGYVEDSYSLIRSFYDKRISKQISKDGSQPNELKRVNSFDYSCYNIHHIIEFLTIAKGQGIPLAYFDQDLEKRLQKAIDFVLPFILEKNNSTWNYSQSNSDENFKKILLKDIYLFSTFLGCENSSKYLTIYYNNYINDIKDEFFLLWL